MSLKQKGKGWIAAQRKSNYGLKNMSNYGLKNKSNYGLPQSSILIALKYDGPLDSLLHCLEGWAPCTAWTCLFMQFNLYVRYNILFFGHTSWDVSPVCDPRQKTCLKTTTKKKHMYLQCCIKHFKSILNTSTSTLL